MIIFIEPCWIMDHKIKLAYPCKFTHLVFLSIRHYKRFQGFAIFKFTFYCLNCLKKLISEIFWQLRFLNIYSIHPEICEKANICRKKSFKLNYVNLYLPNLRIWPTKASLPTRGFHPLTPMFFLYYALSSPKIFSQLSRQKRVAEMFS
jgi:hypothetical protein